MTELLTAAQMRAIEAAAIASGAVTGLELMERAGRGVVEAIFEEWPELQAGPFRAVVLCGPGNNGGDGFVVARLLKEWGWEVEVFLYGDADKLPPDARVNYARWCGMGDPENWDDDRIEHVLDEQDHEIVVDALFGIGLSRPLGDDTARTWRGFAPAVWTRTRQRYVAVDVPSGICGDSGRNLEGAFPANLTVTFHLPKVGHFLSDTGPLDGGPEMCGKLRVTDIGLPKKAYYGGISLVDTHPDYLRKWNLQAHKYTHGHALILSGGSGKGGAARLAARGALRIGAGLVTVGCLPEALLENAARLDAVMLTPIADADALSRVLEDGRIKALCLGPGLGTGAREVALLAVALGLARESPPPPSPPREGEGGRLDYKRRATGEAAGGEALPLPLVGRGEGRGAQPTVVIDADALTILSREPELFALLHEGCVLTPHAGEFARLFPDIAAKLAAPATKGPAYSKVDACREAAARAGCVVLLKGPDTVIAEPKGQCSISSAHYERAAPWLATAGSGDVLAGFITGLLARGFSPMAAAETAAWLHVECARKFGPGLIAEDLPEQIPAVFRDLGL